MTRAIALEPVGVVHRALFGARRLLAFDDIERVENGVAFGRGGERVVLGALHERVAAIVRGPSLDGPAFAAWTAGPHPSRSAAIRLVAHAEAMSATDLHIEPTGSGALVRLRLDGELESWCTLDASATMRLVAALKGLAGCLPYRLDVVQEGRLSRPGIGADIRASFVPTALGERVALRLFGRLRTLDELGLETTPRARFEELLGARTGLVLIAGATGAGKTTTLYAALAHIAAARNGAHLSLEDPVEQRLRVAGIPVDQVELDPARGRSGEAMLAAALRQDIDVLCVGEIRTAEEASLAVKAAHTGRLVLAGVHAGSCEEAMVRMLDLGVDRALLQATLRGTMHQGLVTEQCCRNAGCPRCGGRGRRRRLVAHVTGTKASLEVAA